MSPSASCRDTATVPLKMKIRTWICFMRRVLRKLRYVVSVQINIERAEVYMYMYLSLGI